MSTANPSAGYYADPSVPGYIRYWDGNEWLEGSSRPAPEGLAEQASAGSAAEQGSGQSGQGSGTWQPEPAGAAPAAQPQQASQSTERRQQGLIQSGTRQYGQVPQQYAPSSTPVPSPSATPMPFAQPAPTPSPEPAPAPVPAPTPMPFTQSAPSAPVASEIPESVGTMIVPSAFAHMARSGNGYSFPGQTGNPFAGLPGSDSVAPGYRQSSAPEVAAATTTVVELASPGSRILARIIDLGIAVIFSAPLTITLLLIAHQHDHQYVLKLDAHATTTYTTLGMDGLGIALWVGALLSLMIVSIVYEGNRLSRGGQTIGRRLAGVRVVRMPDGLPLGRDGVGTRRALLFWILAIIPVVDILALGGMFWGRPYRQGLHEKLTSTATVKT